MNIRHAALIALLVACGRDGETTLFILESEFTDSTYRVEVYRHPDLPAPTETTVLVVLDGDWYGSLAARQVDRLVASGAVPPLVVSVGYDDGNQRVRDLTPTRTSEGSGGLDGFTRVLEEEVLPLVEEDGSGGSPERRVLFGHSLGGLAATHIWMQRPPVYDAVIAVSPSYWWDEAVSFGELDRVAPQGRIYMAVGSQENLSIAALAQEMSSRLQQREGVDLLFERLPRRNHNSVVAPAMRRGLQRMFP